MEAVGEKMVPQKSILETEKKKPNHGSLNVLSAFDDLFIEYQYTKDYQFFVIILDVCAHSTSSSWLVCKYKALK